MAENRHKIRLIFIINGRHYPIEANMHAPLMEAELHVLAESKNTGRPPDEWEVSDASGMMLKQKLSPHDLGLHKGARLFLGLRAAQMALTAEPS